MDKLSHLNGNVLGSELPEALSRGRTVEAWCDALREMHGVRIAVRTMKKRARQQGQFLMCGKQMLLLPEHVDACLKDQEKNSG